MTLPAALKWSGHLLTRIRAVRQTLGESTHVPEDAGLRFADVLDSMGMVEFLLLVGEDCGVSPERIEQCVHHRFTTVGDLAAALDEAGLTPRQAGASTLPVARFHEEGAPARSSRECWLAATAVQLPDTVQTAAFVNEQIGRPPGWLEDHAGIRQRRVWGEQDPLAAAAKASSECLERAALSPTEVGALLVTSEAPPRLAGLAALLHYRLGLPADAVALEIGGACTGFLAALWLARQIQAPRPAILVVALEAPTHFLSLQPGPAGEAAALFGDGAAACLFTSHAATPESVPVTDVLLGADGSGADLIQIRRFENGALAVQLQGQALSVRALKAMGRAVRALAEKHHLSLADVAAVFLHGGNGRFPALLARHLEMMPERVCSQTPETGNLGSASLPVAWAAQPSLPGVPAIWTSVGAGLISGAVLLGVPNA